MLKQVEPWPADPMKPVDGNGDLSWGRRRRHLLGAEARQQLVAHGQLVDRRGNHDGRRLDVVLDDTLDVALDRFSEHDAASLAVLSNTGDGRVIGVLTRTRLMREYQHALAES